ncbi:MAG: hypothetical protein JSS77_15890 [Acidobacteria bacterium]|nr:hypothetical protein [Acidobacteriota bacterium]
MIYLLASIVLAIACVLWEESHGDDSPFPLVVGVPSALAAVVLIVSIAMARADAYDHLAQRDALQATYNELRSHPSYEMATVGRDIAEWNAWLASAQYWNKTQWDFWWPDAVMSAKPIR